MTEKTEHNEKKGLPVWLAILWFGFLVWIVAYIVINLFQNNAP